MPVDNLCRTCNKNSVIFDKTRYYQILSEDFPRFLNAYIQLPLLQRLSGIGLLCGTDWTPLYHNQFFYSRLDHSTGVALILWHFTHNKMQTIAGLLHDVSTPAFSHVSDFRNGDALRQESTEEKNAAMIHADKELEKLLKEDGLTPFDVDNYHRFSVADNEIPHLSSDRLEYMFPSGMALNGSFDMDSTARLYKNISLCYNELDEFEPGFLTEDCAAEYCERFCNAGLVLQKNENKLSLQLLAEILNLAVRCGIVTERDFFTKSEKELIDLFDCLAASEHQSMSDYKRFRSLYKTFRTMTKIEHTSKPLDGCFCVSLNVKKRYIDPLVLQKTIQTVQTQKKENAEVQVHKGKRITAVSNRAKTVVDNFLSYSDTLYGCVKLVDN